MQNERLETETTLGGCDSAAVCVPDILPDRVPVLDRGTRGMDTMKAVAVFVIGVAFGWWLAPRRQAGPVPTVTETPSLRYWQHDETGRMCATVLKPSERWHEISWSQYDPTRQKPKGNGGSVSWSHWHPFTDG